MNQVNQSKIFSGDVWSEIDEGRNPFNESGQSIYDLALRTVTDADVKEVVIPSMNQVNQSGGRREILFCRGSHHRRNPFNESGQSIQCCHP